MIYLRASTVFRKAPWALSCVDGNIGVLDREVIFPEWGTWPVRGLQDRDTKGCFLYSNLSIM
jgi:hypothetical protein